MLHDVVEVANPKQSLPPHDGSFFDLERVLEPEPHVWEHDPHDPQLFQVHATKKRVNKMYASQEMERN